MATTALGDTADASASRFAPTATPPESANNAAMNGGNNSPRRRSRSVARNILFLHNLNP
jgi:hypothetical protein